MRLKVIRRASYKAVPWKNGGGITHEALRVPASGDPFQWRVSVARVDASGPFSDFAGYHRTMVLLQGAGVELRFGDGTHKVLRTAGELAEFDGAASTLGELIDGPCMDLNLIVSKRLVAEARVERGSISRVRAGAGATVLALPIDHAVEIVVEGGEVEGLEPWDLAVLSEGVARIEPRAGGPAMVFIATLSELVRREQ